MIRNIHARKEDKDKNPEHPARYTWGHKKTRKRPEKAERSSRAQV